jgi:hypothetical protein
MGANSPHFLFQQNEDLTLNFTSCEDSRKGITRASVLADEA